jgi:hypothetical protein
LKGTLSSRDKIDIDNEIEVIEAFTNSLGDRDEAKIYVALANYENTLHYEQEALYNSLAEDATDDEKREYYRALNVYTYVSEKLGDTSPAKEIAAQAEIDALNDAALLSLTENIRKAKNLQSLMGYLREASRGTNPLPDLTSSAGNPAKVTEVLALIAEQPEFAE